MDHDLKTAKEAAETARAIVLRVQMGAGSTDIRSLAEAVHGLALAVEALIEKQSSNPKQA
jgi:hypothetical protein